MSSGLRAPYVLQSAFTLERQFRKLYARPYLYQFPGVTHAALPGYQRAAARQFFSLYRLAACFLFANPGTSNPSLMESSGLYNQNQLIVNVNSRVNQALLPDRPLHEICRDEQYGRVGYVSGESIRLFGRIRPRIRRRAESGEDGRIDQFKMDMRLSPLVVRKQARPSTSPPAATCTELRSLTAGRASPRIPQTPVDPNPVWPAGSQPVTGEILPARNFGRGPGHSM